MLDLGYLGHGVSGQTVVVLGVLGHRKPTAEHLPAAEQLIESRAKLTAHRAVQDEVYGRVYQRQYVHRLAWNHKKK